MPRGVRQRRRRPVPSPRLTIIGLAPAATFLRPSVDDRLTEHDRGGGAVTGDVIGLAGSFLEELCAHVLERILELDVTRDGHAVVGDGGSAVPLVQRHVASLGAERHLDGIGKPVNAPHE